MRNALITVFILLACIACSKSKPDPPRTGGGDGSVTISGTINVDGTTLTIYDMMPTGKILYGPTVVGLTYSASFPGIVTSAHMVWSKTGCKDSSAGIAVQPGSKISGINSSLICG